MRRQTVPLLCGLLLSLTAAASGNVTHSATPAVASFALRLDFNHAMISDGGRADPLMRFECRDAECPEWIDREEEAFQLWLAADAVLAYTSQDWASCDPNTDPDELAPI